MSWSAATRRRPTGRSSAKLTELRTVGHARDQLRERVERDRLHQVVVEAGVLRPHPVFFLPPAGQRDRHRAEVRRGLAHALADLDAEHLGLVVVVLFLLW